MTEPLYSAVSTFFSVFIMKVGKFSQKTAVLLDFVQITPKMNYDCLSQFMFNKDKLRDAVIYVLAEFVR